MDTADPGQFAVSTVLIVTTTLVAISIPFVKGLPYVLGIAFMVFFGFIDGCFWGASLKKIPHGALFFHEKGKEPT
jgi:KUP system potassium uptake protein